MSIINNVNEVLHRIRVKLYPNYLPGVHGMYIARTESEASLSVEQVCAALKNRGGFTGKYEDLLENIRQFMDEAAYQICDGYAVNMGYFSVHPNIGGTFDAVNDTHNHKKHPVSFRFRTLRPLRNLIQHIAVDITGLADANAFIDEYIDNEEVSVNNLYVPGNLFSICGNKIKVAGDNPDCGVFFVPIDNPSKAVKVSRLAENTPTKIIGIAPNTEFVNNRIEIRTQFTGSSSTFLKTPRVITSSFIIEAA
jgi:hypothetical protein